MCRWKGGKGELTSFKVEIKKKKTGLHVKEKEKGEKV